MLSKIKGFFKRYNFSFLIAAIVFLLMAVFKCASLVQNDFVLGSVNYQNLITYEMNVAEVAHDAEKPYYYIRFDMNNSGPIIVDGTMSINNGPLISYSPEDKAIFMIDQRAVKNFTSGNNVFCYSLVINGEEVYSYERYLLNYQQYRDELYSDGYQAMAYLLAAVLIMESGLFFKKEKLIKKGEIEECVA